MGRRRAALSLEFVMTTKGVAVRLYPTGQAEVKNAFAEVGQAGTREAERLADAFEQNSARAERAMRNAAANAAKLSFIDPSMGSFNIVDQGRVTQQDQTQQFREAKKALADFNAEQAAYERRAATIRGLLDPLWAAQERYNKSIAEARTLNQAKLLTDEQLIQRERQLTLVLEQETIAIARHGQSMGRGGMASLQAGQQVQDFFIQVQGGQSILIAASQQLSQLGFVLQGTEGAAGSFAKLISGPYGTAVLIGVSVLSLLIPKLLETKEGVKKAVEELEKQAKASEDAGQAAIVFAHTQDGVHDSLLKAEDARKKATDGLLSHAEASNIAAKNNLEFIDGNLRAAQSLLALRRAQLEQLNGAGGSATAGTINGISGMSSEVEALEKTIAGMRADRQSWNLELEQSRADLAVEAGKRAADPVARLNRQFDAEVKAARDLAAANHEVSKSLTEQVAAIEKRRQAAIKAAQDDGRKPNYGREVAEDNRADLLAAAQRYAGLSEHRDKGALESLFRQANVSIDPEMVKWCAAFVNAVLATQGLKGTGSLAAKSFLGFGQATSSPTAGDIVVSSRRGQDHVGFFEGFDARGNVKLFSGNSSDKVGESIVNKSDVLGFRRAPTAAQAFADEAKAAKDAEEATARLLDRIGQIEDGFDPAAAAARKLAGQLDDIRKAEGDLLKGGGDISISRGALAMLGAAHPDFLKSDTSWLKRGGEAFDQTMSQWLQEGEVKWKAYEDAANKAGQVVIDNFETMKRAGESLVDTVLSPNTWKSWGSAGKAILREIRNELITLAALNPIKNLLFGDKLPTLLTGLGSLFGRTPAVPHNAAGTEYWSGGMTWVGENGAELLNLPAGSRIRSASAARQAFADGGVNDNRPIIHNDFRGAVVTEDLYRFAMAQADAAAVRGAAGGSRMAVDDMARRRRQSLAGF
jgi:uncharacterized protein (TIGR02594 family)